MTPAALAARLREMACTRHKSDTECVMADCDDRSELAHELVVNLPTIIACLSALDGADGALAKIAEGRDPGGDQTRIADVSELRQYAVDALIALRAAKEAGT